MLQMIQYGLAQLTTSNGAPSSSSSSEPEESIDAILNRAEVVHLLHPSTSPSTTTASASTSAAAAAASADDSAVKALDIANAASQLQDAMYALDGKEYNGRTSTDDGSATVGPTADAAALQTLLDAAKGVDDGSGGKPARQRASPGGTGAGGATCRERS